MFLRHPVLPVNVNGFLVPQRDVSELAHLRDALDTWMKQTKDAGAEINKISVK